MKTLKIMDTYSDTVLASEPEILVPLGSAEFSVHDAIENLREIYYLCWDCLKELIIDEEKENGEKLYVVLAKIGRWDGVYDGGKVIRGLWNAINLMREDMDDFKLYYEGFQLKADGIHHDGTNHFMIRELTKEGVRFYEKYKDELTERVTNDKLFHSRHKSKQVRFLYNCYKK